MQFSFLKEFLGTKMRTLNLYHVMKQIWVSATFLKPHAKQLKSKQCATQSLLNCDNSFSQISWLQNLALTERNVYREACKETEHNFKTIKDTIDLSVPRAACSLMQIIHYSFMLNKCIYQAVRCSPALFTSKRL